MRDTNSPNLSPPKPYLVLMDTLYSCEAYGMRPTYQEKTVQESRAQGVCVWVCGCVWMCTNGPRRRQRFSVEKTGQWREALKQGPRAGCTAHKQHKQGSQSVMPVVCTYRLLSSGNVRASLHSLCLQGLGLPQVQTTPASAKQKATKWLDLYSTWMSLTGQGRDAFNLDNTSSSAVSLTP